MIADAPARMSSTRRRSGLDHQLEGAAEQEVADQNGGLVAPDEIGRDLAAAKRARVHHIVVQQRGGVDELDGGGEIDVLVAGVAAHPGGGEGQHGPQPLAARIDQVPGQVRDQVDRAAHAGMDHLVGRGHVGCDQRVQPFDGRNAVRGWLCGFQASTSIGPCRGGPGFCDIARRLWPGQAGQTPHCGINEARTDRHMRPVLKTNNPVLLSFAQSLLSDAQIECVVFDENASVMDGSLGILPRRLMVADEDVERGQAVLREGIARRERPAETTEDKFPGRPADRAPARTGISRRTRRGDAGRGGAGQER